MTQPLLFCCLFSISSSLFCQNNILDCLRLKEDKIGKYRESEFISTDTIIDISNGYYEQTMFAYEASALSLRQATIFKNADSTLLLGITTAVYDFVCTNYTSHFYEITETLNNIKSIEMDEVLPDLPLEIFIENTKVDSVIYKYLPNLQSIYKQQEMSKAAFLQEFYSIHYIMPRGDTTIQVTLAVCDYLPNSEIHITKEDWHIIANDFLSIPLYYNPEMKKFEQ